MVKSLQDPGSRTRLAPTSIMNQDQDQKDLLVQHLHSLLGDGQAFLANKTDPQEFPDDLRDQYAQESTTDFQY